jgi:hypothetical protein
MCSLRFENNLLTIEGVRFDIEENTIIEASVRFRAECALPTLWKTFPASRQEKVGGSDEFNFFEIFTEVLKRTTGCA